MTRPRLLTVQEAAEALGDKPRYVRYLIETRQITFVRVGKRKVRIPEDVIDGLIQVVPARGVA